MDSFIFNSNFFEPHRIYVNDCRDYILEIEYNLF